MNKHVKRIMEETGESYAELLQDARTRVQELLSKGDYKRAIRYLRDMRPALREEDSAPLWSLVANTQRAQYPLAVAEAIRKLRFILAKGNFKAATDFVRNLKDLKPEDVSRLYRKCGNWFRQNLRETSN